MIDFARAFCNTGVVRGRGGGGGALMNEAATSQMAGRLNWMSRRVKGTGGAEGGAEGGAARSIIRSVSRHVNENIHLISCWIINEGIQNYWVNTNHVTACMVLAVLGMGYF